MNKPMTQASYKTAGVDIDAGNQLVERIKPLAKATARLGCMGGLGGFGALFDPKAAGFKDPILVATTDGVGTKLKVAQIAGKHESIGIDLVAMCVNDLVVQGAEPLFFLDYFATGKLEVGIAEKVIAGIAEGCKQAACALIGGETAEMPSMYGNEEYDLAGFSVGAVERGETLPRGDIKIGDVVLGLTSSGVHSNGYSLVRYLVNQAGLSYATPAPFDTSKSLGDALLAPTKIYVKPLVSLFKTEAGKGVKALAHITGGGLLENIPRVLPQELAVRLNTGSWPVLPVFHWMQQTGDIADDEMWRTFNCGIGMVIVVSKEASATIKSQLEASGETVFTIGEVIPRKEYGVEIV